MEVTIIDFILVNLTSYLLGIATGLLICCKYKDNITRSKSYDNLKQFNHQTQVVQPKWESPILASAPPPSNPVKLTIE